MRDDEIDEVFVSATEKEVKGILRLAIDAEFPKVTFTDDLKAMKEEALEIKKTNLAEIRIRLKKILGIVGQNFE